MKLKGKIILSSFLFVFGAVLNVFISAAFHNMLTDKTMNVRFLSFIDSINIIIANGQSSTFFICVQGFILLFCIFIIITVQKPYQSKTVKITDNIETPVSAGQGQHGTARFMTADEIKTKYDILKIVKNNSVIQRLLKQGEEIYNNVETVPEVEEPPRSPPCTAEDEDNNDDNDVDSNIYFKNGAGIVIGIEKESAGEKLYCVNDDVHSLVIGKTRCGKTRCLVLPTIITLGLAGESIVVSDPKGELYFYTSRLLKELGYDVHVIDFQTPKKSYCYNPLQKIIEAVNNDETDLAQTYAWDLVCFLVEKSERAEPIWQNGEMAVLAAGILCVVYDNKDNPQYQNMTNVYWFISEMCKDIRIGNSSFKPIVEYVKKLPDTHPAKPLLGIANVAPSKTAGSFYTSALTTLRLFTAKEIYNITRKSDFSLDGAGNKKQALFFILPDEKTTYYPIVTLLVSQMYELLVKSAKNQGNRLPVRVNFILDEFGNFSSITDFSVKLTVGGGYGIRFSLFLQDFNQLTDKYGKEKAFIIRGNCGIWVYLSTNDGETLSELERRLGEYTVSTYSIGGSTQKFTKPSSNQNSSLQGRKLLFASELGKLNRPHQIIITSDNPAVMYAPDLSKWIFNKMLGLGDKTHNVKYIIQFQNSRPDIAASDEDIALWGVWNEYNTPAGRIRNLNNNRGEF